MSPLHLCEILWAIGSGITAAVLYLWVHGLTGRVTRMDRLKSAIVSLLWPIAVPVLLVLVIKQDRQLAEQRYLSRSSLPLAG